MNLPVNAAGPVLFGMSENGLGSLITMKPSMNFITCYCQRMEKTTINVKNIKYKSCIEFI